MLSPENALLLARVLPWLEVALGLLLISGIALRWVGSLTTVLLVVFMYALARAAIKGLAINCGCFGNESTSPARELALDSLLLLTALGITVGAFLSRRAERLPTSAAPAIDS
jgi:Methylamine utilisation protein MauE